MSASAEDLEHQDPTRDPGEPTETPAGEAPPTPEEGQEPESAAHETGQPDRKGDFNRRYAQERARRARAEEQRDYWRDQALRKQVEMPAAPEPQDPEPAAPNPADFEGDYEKLAQAQTQYVKDVREWDKRQVRKAEERSRKEAEERDRNAQLTERQRKQVSMAEAGRTAHEDFEDVAFDPSLHVSQDMLDFVTDAENGHEILYALGKKPAEAARIAALTGREAVLAMATFSASMSQSPARKGSDAPPPPNPAKGGGDAAAVDEDKLSAEESIRRDRERRSKAGRR